MVVIKNTTNSADWVVYDKQRSPTGNFDDYLYLNKLYPHDFLNFEFL